MRKRKRTRESCSRINAGIATLLLAIGGLTSAPEALAQPEPNIDLQIDQLAERADEIQRGAERRRDRAQHGPFSIYSAWDPQPGPNQSYIWLAADMPLTLNSNPANANIHSSGRFDPKFLLNAVKQFETMKLTAGTAVDFDRYLSNPAASVADSSTVLANVRLDLNRDPDLPEPRTRAFIPYVLYQLGSAYSSDASRLNTRTHDLGAGLRAGKKLDPKGVWKISADTRVTKRQSSAPRSNSQAINLKPSATWTPNETWSFIFAPSLQVRVFDDAVNGVERRDRTVLLPLQIAWDPPANKLFDKDLLEIVFTIGRSRTHSTISAKESTQWETGPMLHLIFRQKN